LQLNERAHALAQWCITHASELRIAVHRLGNGACVIDAGIDTPAGFGAGQKMAAICMGGLGEIAFAPLSLDGTTWPGVQVWTDHPALACMASQYAGWQISSGSYFAMGSGPLRAHARVEKELFAKLGYAEEASRGVLVLETRTLPTEDVVEWIAHKARLQAAALTLVVAPTASIAGGVQVVARVIETGLHKMETLGFDILNVTSAMGTAPLPPTARSDTRAIGRTNDCVLYGGQAHYTVRASDEELAQLAEQLPASASSDYGTPFYDIFQRYDRDFYKIDPHLFSPAEVWLTSATSGRTFHAGHIAVDVLRASLFD
jgi:methenyltetrahydromethanopterin cyclohydrolase